MKRFVVIISFLSLILFLNGCAANITNVAFPKPSDGFQRNKIFNQSSTAMFQKIENVLEDNRIRIDTSDKANGKIVTDYIQGESKMYAGGMLGVIQMRYKYFIRIKPINDNSCSVDIQSTLESSGNKMTAWREITNNNDLNIQTAKNLEDWLYEKISK